MNYLKFIKKYPRQLSFSFTHIFFSALGQTFIFALFVPELEKAFNLTPAQSGSYYGTVTLLSAFLLFYTGSLIDKFSLKIYSTAVVTLLCLGAVLIALAPGVGVMLVGMFLLRHFGQGLMIHTGNVAAAKYFTQNRGKALTIAGMGISASTALVPIFVASIIALYGWQAAYLALAALTFICCMSVTHFGFKRDDKFLHPHLEEDEKTPEFLEEEELNWGRKQLISHPHFWMVLPLVISPGYFITALVFHQARIAEMQGWSMPLIASAFVMYGVMSFVASLIAGPLIDRFSGNVIQKFMLLPYIACGGILFLGTHETLAYVYLGLMGFGVGFAAANMAMWAEVYGRRHVGAIKSFVGTIVIMGTAAAPVVFGLMVESGWSVGETVLAHIIFMAFATVLAIFAPLPKRVKRR